jgi:hypothetical protein
MLLSPDGERAGISKAGVGLALLIAAITWLLAQTDLGNGRFY